MFQSTLNFYSLLIPLILMSMGFVTLLFCKLKSLSNYLAFHSIALMCIGLSLFLHSIFIPSVLLQLLPFVFGLYFLSCILHAHAIYLRLGIQSNWKMLFILLSLGIVAHAYFAIWHDSQTLRMLITGVITACIYLNNPIDFFKIKPQLKIDRYLKVLTITLTTIALGRAILLNHLIVPTEMISTSAMLWASTQLLLIVINIIFLGIFISCSIQDILDKLKLERNRDPLTGLLNRRAFKEYVQQMHWVDQPTPKALMIIDLDHFKQVNDHYGHFIGDLALQHSSKILSQSLSEHDRISRIGGEEFVVILNNASPEHALNIADAIRHQLHQSPLYYAEHQVKLSISIGVSFFEEYQYFDHAFQEADDYLYQAKKMGRNLVQSKFSPV